MPASISPAMIKDLRHLLASAIADAKAYDVPGLCRRLNLADGDDQEAFASKYKYAQKRLVEVSSEQVVASARQLAAEENHFELSEQLAKIDELKGPAITTLTRRRLIALFEGRPLAREVEDIELIRGLWPIASLQPPHPSDEATLEDYLFRHTIRNDDLTQRDVLETLGLLTCSRAQLFKFLAAVTAPEARSETEQVELAGKIDTLLRHDGYTLALAGRILGSPFYAVRPAPTNGVETVFDSDCNMEGQGGKHTEATVTHRWRRRLPLSLRGAAASGTLPAVREAEEVDGGYYWDGLYSQNQPVREFLAGVRKEATPDELWILRINPQQRAQQPQSNADIQDRENELMGNLSLNKELDFVLTVNDWSARFGGEFANHYKHVTVRTIKMTEATATELRTSSKFNRSRGFIDRLRKEGHTVAQDWLARWPDVGCYPDDAAYW